MPKAVCREPLCSGFAEIGTRCETHHKSIRKETRSRTPGAKLYNTPKWRNVRKTVLRRDRYTCQSCLKFGNEVDHVTPISKGGAEYNTNNLQTLCKSCHSRKTAREVLGK